MDWEFSIARNVRGIVHQYTGTAEIRQNTDAKWSWEVGNVFVWRKIGRGTHLVTADPDLAKAIRRQLLIGHGSKITVAWRRCQEGGNKPREFSEYVRSVV